ncbi:hypothetical protein ACPA9J_33910 [Pseudomonas aeruginosa]
MILGRHRCLQPGRPPAGRACASPPEQAPAACRSVLRPEQWTWRRRAAPIAASAPTAGWRLPLPALLLPAFS